MLDGELSRVLGVTCMRTVLITGGSTGIGLALAGRLLSQHDTRVVVTSRTATRGEAAISGLVAAHPGYFMLISLLLARIEGAHGRVVVASEKARDTNKHPTFAWSEMSDDRTSDKDTAYVRSKLANLQFADALHRRATEHRRVYRTPALRDPRRGWG